jgi:cell division septation protein DedD
MAPTALPPPAVTPAGKEEPAQETETTQEINAARPFHIQVGVYSRTKIMAVTLKALKKAGFKPKVLKVKTEDMTYPLCKIRVGDYPDRASAKKAANLFTKKTRMATFVVED